MDAFWLWLLNSPSTLNNVIAVHVACIVTLLVSCLTPIEMFSVVLVGVVVIIARQWYVIIKVYNEESL